MVNQKILNALAVFSSAYAKRWLEGHFYDKIFETQLGERLKTLDKKAKYGVEFGLNLLTVLFDQKLAEDAVLKRFVKEVGMDAGPEISKRLINAGEHAQSPEEKEIVKMLLQLDEQTLVELLNWLYDMKPNERVKVLKHISRLSFDELVRIAGLPTNDMGRIFDLTEPQAKVKKMDPLLSPKIVEEIKGTTAKIEEMRKQFREKRKAR